MCEEHLVREAPNGLKLILANIYKSIKIKPRNIPFLLILLLNWFLSLPLSNLEVIHLTGRLIAIVIMRKVQLIFSEVQIRDGTYY